MRPTQGIARLKVRSAVQFTAVVATFRSSHWRCSVRIGVLGNFTKFTGKHLCQSIIFNKNETLDLFKKKLSYIGFPVNFCEIFKNTFFTEHLWTTTSEVVFFRPVYCYDLNEIGLFRRYFL